MVKLLRRSNPKWHYGRYAPWRLYENRMRHSWKSWFAVGRDPHTPFDAHAHRGKVSWKAGMPGYWSRWL